MRDKNQAECITDWMYTNGCRCTCLYIMIMSVDCLEKR